MSNGLQRYAFKMKLHTGQTDEYKRRHDQIWPDLCRALTAAGISDYSIYLDEETSTLFAFQKLTHGNTAHELPDNPIVKVWWEHMSDIMECNEDNSPIETPLKEMFHMD